MIFPHDFEHKLGFDQVRQKLKNYCLSPLGIAHVEAIQFSSDFKTTSQLLKRNLEFKQILEKGEQFPLSGYFDPTELFQVASIEDNFIDEDGFRDIILSLHTISACKTFLNANQQYYPELYYTSSLTLFPKAVLIELESKFDDTFKVRDNATPELQKIRKRLREEQSRIRRLTDQVYRQSVEQGWVPEGATPTIRDGRLVIPVLAEFKRKLRGFIMDESSTGQTVYMEPAEVLEANNEIRDLIFAERREVVKVLKELTSLLRRNLPELWKLYELLGILDFNYAKAKFSLDVDSGLPQLKPEPFVDWIQARHPLLFLTLRGKRPIVPLSIRMDSKDRFILVSGPNAGGKSVCIKTVSLIQYMLQCGLLVPMNEKSTMGFFGSIFIDIGDQQSIENDLSTYSSHLKNMNHFIRYANDQSLVILDELGSGTDPNFGGGIAEAILESLIDKKVWGLATTHYYNLKLFAERKPGIRNGSMLFDTQKLEPLFQFEMGKPGSSFALEIARKTGLPPATLGRAEQLIGKDLTGLESLMKRVAEEKQQQAKKEIELRQREQSLNETTSKYKVLLSELESKKKEIIDKAKTEASHLLKETNREIEKTIRHIKENKAQKNETRKVRENLKGLVEKVQPQQAPQKPVKHEALKEGDKVRIIGQEVTGTILTLKGNSALVQFGDLRSSLKLSQLVRSDLVDYAPAPSRSKTGFDILKKQSSFNPTLDLRGKRAEEVLPILEQFMDDAILLSQGELKILHGKGEGVLRKIVREKLKTIKGVASFADDHADRGGEGVTIVVLK